jgi:hypothetical protein
MMKGPPGDNAVKQEMIQLSVNPYDARKWLEDCCEAGCLIGRKDPDSLQWVPWVAGEELPFHVLLNAYIEWQKSVKTHIAPEPTPSNTLGKVLTGVGFGSHPTKSEMRRTLPEISFCLKRLFIPSPLKKERKKDIRWLMVDVGYFHTLHLAFISLHRWGHSASPTGGSDFDSRAPLSGSPSATRPHNC